MTTPTLPEVDRVAADVFSAIKQGSPSPTSVWQITGEPTSGKSVLFSKLSQQLQSESFWPVIVAPPVRALDAGPAALVQIGGILKERAVINGKFDGILLSQTLPWADKINHMREWIDQAADRLVLLCDEPLEWSTREDPHFAERTEDVVQLLLGQVKCRRIVSGSIHSGIKPVEKYHLVGRNDPRQWLSASENWGTLSGSVVAIRDRMGEKLGAFTPLEIRLLVAHVALSDIDSVKSWLPTMATRREISWKLAHLLSQTKTLTPLRELWARIALVRRPFTADLFAAMGASGLDAKSKDILRHCLLYAHGDNYVLHETLRVDARQWLDDKKAVAAHKLLAEYYKDRFGVASSKLSITESKLSEMEAFYHATSSRDANILDRFTPFFAEQLDALGRVLSRDARKYGAAASIFERAFAWDSQDDYAHHYFAFNLDILGSREKDVEAHYQKALALNPKHEWWHARYIYFLITLGRTGDARAAWDKALDCLGLPDPNTDSKIYESLYLWVASLLLHRGQLDFARTVLSGIPDTVREHNPVVKATARRLQILLDARQFGTVFPGTVPPERRWTGPQLNAQLKEDGKKLTIWMPARIDSIEIAEKQLHLYVANPPPDKGGSPTYGNMTLDFAKFNKWSRDERAEKLSAGRFVEIAFYGHGKNAPAVIRVHRETSWDDPDLLPLFPHPLRYGARKKTLV